MTIAENPPTDQSAPWGPTGEESLPGWVIDLINLPQVIYPADQRDRCEDLLRMRASGNLSHWRPEHVDRGIEIRLRFLPKVAGADDYAKVEPGRAYVTTGDGTIRWKAA